ncbi:MAG: MoaD/ThiS family protein [Pseudomonadota bacterium]
MVKVNLWGSLKAAASGRGEIEVEAANIRQIFRALEAEEPGLAPVLSTGITVAIDGQIYRDDWFQEVDEDSEVYLLPRMEGG